MAFGPALYKAASKYFRCELVMRLKDTLRPAKHFLFGKQRIYKAIEVAGALERARGNEVAVAFDIGAAIGEAAMPLARAYPAATVYCFEPLSDSFVRLKERTAAFSSRIRYFNFGLSDHDGEEDFYVFPHRDASTLIPQKEAAEKITIPVRRLDAVVEQEGVERIHFMKIDVEGAEKEVLRGGLHTLTHRVDNVFIEISPLRKGLHSHDYIDVFEYLHQAGFSFVAVYEDYLFSKLLSP